MVIPSRRSTAEGSRDDLSVLHNRNAFRCDSRVSAGEHTDCVGEIPQPSARLGMTPWASATGSLFDVQRSAFGVRRSAFGVRRSAFGRSAFGALGVGRWALGVGRWALGVGRWALGVGRWALGVGRWALGVGRWALGVGRWALGVGRWRSAHPARALFYWSALCPRLITRISSVASWTLSVGRSAFAFPRQNEHRRPQHRNRAPTRSRS